MKYEEAKQKIGNGEIKDFKTVTVRDCGTRRELENNFERAKKHVMDMGYSITQFKKAVGFGGWFTYTALGYKEDSACKQQSYQQHLG